MATIIIVILVIAGFIIIPRILDKHRMDKLCASLCGSGLDAQMVERRQPEQHVARHGGGPIAGLLGFSSDKSLGLIEIQGSPIRWVNVIKEKGGQHRGDTFRIAYLVPDTTVSGKRYLELKSVRVKSIPVFGRVVDLRWKGKYEGENVVIDETLIALKEDLIRRLSQEVLLGQTLVKLKEDIEICGYPEYECWAISSSWDPMDWLGRPRKPATLRERWECYEIVATILLGSSRK